MNSVAFAPIGFSDQVCIANNHGAARTLVPSWGHLSARSIIADAAVCTLAPNDTASGGAGFVDSPVYLTTDGGTLDGTTNGSEIIGFLSLAALWGNTSMTRYVGFDAFGAGSANPIVTTHWSGAGVCDTPTTASLTEAIGLRVRALPFGTTKIGVQSQHRFRLYTAAANFDALIFTAIEMPAVNLSAVTDGWQFAVLNAQSTVVASENSNSFVSGQLFNNVVTFKNANAQAQTIALFIGENQSPTIQGDGATLTHGGVIAFRDALTVNRINAGAVSMTSHTALSSAPTVDTGCTVTTRKVSDVVDFAGAGTVTTQIAHDIAQLTKGGTNIGIRNASTEVATPSVATITAVGSTITPNAKVKRLDNTSGGSLTLTSTPTIPDGQDGQILKLFNSSAQNVVLQDQGTLASSNLRLTAASITLGPRDTVELMYSTTVGDWIQFTPVVAVL
jgi:hypothetical protein